ncbi:myosin-G heavy chain-like [Dendronephthya gigantea]|uniref:myosin-G heavy chain-like n=1 Tax=Dendronephthya gigantea TaxID=151771 RepID=UPI0010692CE2|nr:myosin-G heavy chain-like [Dendronephthya gigantea]
MTFDLILSSLLYHEREWFVFQDILTHLPQENAAEASQRSKTTPKYTYRFGITKDWVTGDGKRDLIDRHFIDSKDPGRNLIFSSVLIDAERVQELFLKSFNKKFRLKVQQFNLTFESLDSSWFEWHFDPKQKDGCVVKKTKLTVQEANSKSNPSLKTPDKKQNSEDMPPNLSSGETSTQISLSLKRRRPIIEKENEQSSSNFSPSISESVLMRPRKKAKEANQSINKYHEDDKSDVPVLKEEPMSPDYKPDMANIKRSPCESEETKTNPSMNFLSQNTLKNDLSSSINDADSDGENTPSANTNSQKCHTTLQESSQNNESSTQNMNANSANDVGLFHNGISQDSSNIVGKDLDDIEDVQNDNNDTDKITKTVDDISANVGNTTNNVDNSTVDNNNSAEETSSMDEYVPDSNMLDDANRGSHNESPTSSLLDDSKNIMANIKLQRQELCTEEEVLVANNQPSEQPSTSTDTNLQVDSNKHDCGAKAYSSSGASSTVCLCTNAESSEQKSMVDTVRNTEASELLDGLRAAGFVPLVRKLLENVQGDTRLSQMEQELNTIGNQINQKRKANRQLQKNIKKKAGELEKLFDNLRKGKTHCEMLEQKYKALQDEKTTVEAKVKKCLEVLNSVD